MNMVVGSALLKNTPRGVRVFGRFNHTDNGRTAKELVKDGSVSHLSIYANQLEHSGNNVVHGNIKEVSLVTNPTDKYAIAHIKGQEYNYSALELLMSKVASPYTEWDVVIST